MLGLNAHEKRDIDKTLASKREEVKIVEFRTEEDDYPDAQPVPAEEAQDSFSEGSGEVDVRATDDIEE